MLFIGFIIGVLISSGFMYAILQPKIKQTQKIDNQIIEQNKIAQQDLKTCQNNLQFSKEQLNTIQSELKKNIDNNNQIRDFVQKTKNNLWNEISEHTVYMNSELEKEELKIENAKNSYKEEYLQLMKDLTSDLETNIANSQNKYNELTIKLEDLQKKVEAAVAANKRAAEMETKIDFYRLVLSDVDIEEISKLRSIMQYLRDAEPLNKVIWKVYYEKPYTDLIGRVVGSSVKTGIYKITNLTNQMCYVGKSTNIADRWKQHIKRGIGAEAPTRNKLYPAMLKFGVENFSFEIVEECTKDLLDSREDYWQDYFKAKEFGYSIK